VAQIINKMNPANNIIIAQKIIDYMLCPAKPNSINNINFAQKIIGYSISNKIEREEKHKKLKDFFEVNKTWAETVIKYSDHIWGSFSFLQFYLQCKYFQVFIA
jgi:hypothetical protein